MDVENDYVETRRDLVVYGFSCMQGKLEFGPGSTYRWLLPDLLISVNFTELRPDVPMDNPTSSQSVSHIVIGLLNSTDILQTTTPFPLIQGANIVASIVGDIRQVFLRPAWSALGILQVCAIHSPFKFGKISVSRRGRRSFGSPELLLRIPTRVSSSIRISVHCASSGKMIGPRLALSRITVKVPSLLDLRVLAVFGRH